MRKTKRKKVTWTLLRHAWPLDLHELLCLSWSHSADFRFYACSVVVVVVLPRRQRNWLLRNRIISRACKRQDELFRIGNAYEIIRSRIALIPPIDPKDPFTPPGELRDERERMLCVQGCAHVIARVIRIIRRRIKTTSKIRMSQRCIFELIAFRYISGRQKFVTFSISRKVCLSS